MNVGGPAVEVANLMRELPTDRFEQRLLVGDVAAGEADFLSNQGVDLSYVRIAGLGRALKPLDDFRAFLAIRSEIKLFHPDIVHTHTAKAGGLGRLAALTVRPRPKLVHTFHGHVLSGYFSSMTNFVFTTVERVLGWFTNVLITVGPEVRNELLDAGIGSIDRFHIIEPGVALQHHPSRSSARAHFGLDDHQPVISVVGRLTQIKRPDRMLDVVEKVAAEIPNLMVLVAGGGELLEETRRTALSRSLPIRFLGWTNDVETVFAASDLTLLTSDNEGTPISIMQAALLGVPAVVSNVGSVKHMVTDGESGWLARPDASELASATVAALSDSEERTKRSEAVMKIAGERFTVSRYVAQHRDLYSNM
jgi:glycosyltransferase involved in cell wall biosynthesis